MKRGVKVYGDYDRTGKMVVKIEKSRGRLSLDDIRDALKEYDQNFYFLVVNTAVDDEGNGGYEQDGDLAVLYYTDEFMED